MNYSIFSSTFLSWWRFFVACDILLVFLRSRGVSTSCRMMSCWASCLRPGRLSAGAGGIALWVALAGKSIYICMYMYDIDVWYVDVDSFPGKCKGCLLSIFPGMSFKCIPKDESIESLSPMDLDLDSHRWSCAGQRLKLHQHQEMWNPMDLSLVNPVNTWNEWFQFCPESKWPFKRKV